MRQTFEELLNNLPGEDKINNGNQRVVIDLMKQVRFFTLQECAKKAKTKEDWWQDNGNPEGFSYTIVDKDSILNLDLNSIEIDG